MIRNFKTNSEYNIYTAGGLKSGDLYYVEDTGKFTFYTNNIDGETKVYNFYGRTVLSAILEGRIKSISIPNGTTKIGDYALCACSELKNVVIPDSVTVIGKRAFIDCPQLTSITIYATTPPTLDVESLDANIEGRIIYVPVESVAAYKAATNWSTYADSIQAITE